MSAGAKLLPEPFQNFTVKGTSYIRTVATEGEELPGKSDKTGLPLPLAIFSPGARRLLRVDSPGAWYASAKKGKVQFNGRIAEIQVIETKDGKTKDDKSGAKVYRFTGPTIQVDIRGPEDFRRIFGALLDEIKPTGLVGSLWTGAFVSGRNERLLQSACNWTFVGRDTGKLAKGEEWTTSLDAYEGACGDDSTVDDNSDDDWDGQLTSVADSDDEYN